VTQPTKGNRLNDLTTNEQVKLASALVVWDGGWVENEVDETRRRASSARGRGDETTSRRRGERGAPRLSANEHVSDGAHIRGRAADTARRFLCGRARPPIVARGRAASIHMNAVHVNEDDWSQSIFD
jgi:hypothetical protein